jgi:shikimate kinase
VPEKSTSANKTIALIGYRGSGKTTVGKLLAERLGTTLIDLDFQVKARIGTSIAEYFLSHGEEAFRDHESAALAEVLASPPGVLASGGGVILREANRALLRAECFVVWLRAPADWLWLNINADPLSSANRPKLTNQAGIEEVQTVLREREETYRLLAHHVVDATQKPEMVVEEILKSLAPFTGRGWPKAG